MSRRSRCQRASCFRGAVSVFQNGFLLHLLSRKSLCIVRIIPVFRRQRGGDSFRKSLVDGRPISAKRQRRDADTLSAQCAEARRNRAALSSCRASSREYVDLDQGTFRFTGELWTQCHSPAIARFGPVSTDDHAERHKGSLSNNLAAQLSILAIVVIVLLHGHANNAVHTIASRLW